MTTPKPNQDVIGEQELRGLALEALEALGVPAAQAEDTAEILVLADLMGVHTHGVMRVISYGERLRIGGIKAGARITPEHVAPAIIRVDGDNGLGPAVGMVALREAMTAAAETGVGVALCRGSNHFGPVAPYAYLAAEQGFASLIASNATTTIAPTGGSDARLGNNPMGFGFPNPGGDPMILDMAISVVARAKIRNAAKAGEPIPEGWATDGAGRPTTDPNAALKGFLMPFGGYKGYGLSLAVDMLTGVLSGAAFLTHVKSWVDEPEAPQDLGHAFVLIDAKRLGTSEWLGSRMQDFAGIIHDTPRVDPDTPVILPGERELQRLHRQRREGVALDRETLEEIRAIAAGKAR
ncbi:Ldh family oxidoreductase [Lutibaculum baratangense]|uniref:Ureidoglycolate dehydrogenase n=1 Tax=Lutibaculum baratangense AMV1 TaxID=631454 RepID=V4QVD8_9HYPH|nr:Ldh family oxidoreductase [Lutibaculum baratangense]ESR23732.1 Ureidoglycolate dehydrogenase [Lutibaculum baratangense AMV1]